MLEKVLVGKQLSQPTDTSRVQQTDPITQKFEPVLMRDDLGI